MSGFRSQKVTSGAQIVSAVKVGTLHLSQGLLLGREGGSGGGGIERHYNAPVSLLTVGAVQDIMTQSTAEEIYWMELLPGASPASFGEHDDGAGAALEGSLDGTDGDGLCGVTGQMGGATQLLKHLPVEHGCLGLAGDLHMSEKR